MALALEKRMEIVEDRTDSLESILANFMATVAISESLQAESRRNTEASIARQEKSQEESRRNTEAFQKERDEGLQRRDEFLQTKG
ncbi:MAG: hypothetical protein B6245_22255 [Desulfobacteraceae bacterium 4572_88]|nr:MAG: hypothetical protein B6245_22255 [Desulfobacteraceae bacterium 4572_88]